MQLKILFPFIMLILIQNSCAAQQNVDELTTKSKKAKKAYETAELYLNERNFKYAEVELKKAIDIDANFIEAYLVLGDAYYYYMRKTEQSIDMYEKVITINPDFWPKSYYIMAKMELSIGRYEDAKKHFLAFLAYKSINSVDREETENGLLNCEFAIQSLNNPVPFKPQNLGPDINSEFDEYFPCLTVDNQELLYTRQMKDERSPLGVNEDFYLSYKMNGEWTRSINIGAPINTVFNEGAPALSPDGQTLFFTSCDLFDQYGPDRNGYGSCDIFFSKKNGSSFSNPVNIKSPINTQVKETQPSFSSDGKTLYFIRDYDSKKRTQQPDIWMTQIGMDGSWKTPVKLSDKINTDGIEESVFIHPDGQTLYFSSDGHTGMGGLDIFISRKDTNGEWGEPVNLGYPINTFKDESSLMVSSDGKMAYFASGKEGGYGGLDLYCFELPEQFRPQPLTYMKGKVYDKETKKMLEAKFELIDLKTGNIMVESYSNEGNGEFMVSLPVNKNYALNVSKEGYLFYSENFALKETGTITNPVLKDVPLQSVKVGESVVLKNIFFETDKYDLKKESEVELQKLISLLNKNAKIKIELSGHTDNVGGKEHNQSLSENRAKAVFEYLVAHGIAKERLTYKGYGYDIPIDTNDTEAGRANNRRTEFKVIEK